MNKNDKCASCSACIPGHSNDQDFCSYVQEYIQTETDQVGKAVLPCESTSVKMDVDSKDNDDEVDKDE